MLKTAAGFLFCFFFSFREARTWKHQQRRLWGAQGWSRIAAEAHERFIASLSFSLICIMFSWHFFVIVIRQQHSQRPSTSAVGRRQMWYDICVSARSLVQREIFFLDKKKFEFTLKKYIMRQWPRPRGSDWRCLHLQQSNSQWVKKQIDCLTLIGSTGELWYCGSWSNGHVKAPWNTASGVLLCSLPLWGEYIPPGMREALLVMKT